MNSVFSYIMTSGPCPYFRCRPPLYGFFPLGFSWRSSAIPVFHVRVLWILCKLKATLITKCPAQSVASCSQSNVWYFQIILLFCIISGWCCSGGVFFPPCLDVHWLCAGVAGPQGRHHGVTVQPAPAGRPHDPWPLAGDQQEAAGCAGRHITQEHDTQGTCVCWKPVN